MKKVNLVFLNYIDKQIEEIKKMISEIRSNVISEVIYTNLPHFLSEEDTTTYSRLKVEGLYKQDIENICMLENINTRYKKLKDLITPTGYNKFVDYLDMAFMYVELCDNRHQLKFTPEEQVAFLGLIIKNNAKYYNDRQKSIDSSANESTNINDNKKNIYTKACFNLDKFFNADGSLVPYSSKEEFKEKLQLLFDNFDLNLKVGTEISLDILPFSVFINRALKVLDKTNENFDKSKKEEQEINNKRKIKEFETMEYKKEVEKRIKECQTNYKLQRQQELAKKMATYELSNYYLDGEFIAIPPSSEYLITLLEKAGYTVDKVEIIVNKFNIYLGEIEKKKIYLQYISEEEYDIYLQAKKQQENMVLGNLLNDLDTAISLQEELNDEEKDADLACEINELMNQIKVIISTIKLKYN